MKVALRLLAVLSVGVPAVRAGATPTNAAATIVVEASRVDSAVMEMPRAVQVITDREIAASGTRDVGELLTKRCPQLNVSSMYGANPAGRNVAFAGYGENGGGRALVLVDGERLNNADMSMMNFARIDAGSVRSIEILDGPQNVLHGDMASAGVINVVTDPVDYGNHGHAEVHGGSWNSIGASLGYRGGIEEDGVRYWANGGWERSDGYRENSGYDLRNANGGAKWEDERGSYVRASAFYSHSDYELPRALSRADWRNVPRHSVQRDAKYPEEDVDEFRQQSAGMNLTGYGVIDDDNALRLTATASRTRTKSEMFGNGSYDDYDWTTFDYLGLMDYVWASYMNYDACAFRVKPEWINRTPLAGFDRESIVGAAVSYDRIEVESDSVMHYHPQYAASAYSTGSPSDYLMDRLSMAYFAAETVHLSELFAVSAGARYEREWNRLTSAARPRDADDLCAAELSVTYTPSDELKIYVRAARFFRNAYLDEISYRGGTSPQERPDPETGWRTDVGTEWRPSDELALSANAYVSETEDEIFYNPFYVCRGAATKDNVNSPDPVLRAGGTLSAAWEREKRAGLSLAVSAVSATFRGGQFDGNEVPGVPEVTATANGRFWLWSDGYVFGGARFRASCHTLSDFRNEYDELPSFSVFHLGFAWEPSFAAWAKGWKASVVCDNLLDRTYCEYAAYGSAFYPAAGRGVTFSLRYEF